METTNDKLAHAGKDGKKDKREVWETRVIWDNLYAVWNEERTSLQTRAQTPLH